MSDYKQVTAGVGSADGDAKRAGGPRKARYTCFGKAFPTLLFNGLVMLFVVIGYTGQQISLPLYLHTYGSGGGPYFVLWFCSFVFTIFFGAWSLLALRANPHLITSRMLQWKWHPYMLLVGFMDSMNGFLVVYSSPLSRVSGPLQSVLGQAVLAATLLGSFMFLERTPNIKQVLSVIVMYAGAFLGLVPIFDRVADHAANLGTQHWWWALVFFAGQIPGALMNVFQERMQDEFKSGKKYRFRLLCCGSRAAAATRSASSRSSARPEMLALLGEEDVPVLHQHEKEFSVIYFQAVESSYQFLFMTAFFWFDLLPNYGFSENISQFWTAYSFGWQCFFNAESTLALSADCKYSAPLGTLFVCLYITSYISGTFMTRHLSANLAASCQVLSPVLVLLFWYAFPSVNAWAGGTPYALGSKDGIYNVVAMAVLLIGIISFRYFEEDKGKLGQDVQLLDSEGDDSVELLWPEQSTPMRATVSTSLQSRHV